MPPATETELLRVEAKVDALVGKVDGLTAQFAVIHALLSDVQATAINAEIAASRAAGN